MRKHRKALGTGTVFRRFSAASLAWARVRPEPDPPVGAPGSARTFRAGRNYFYVRLLRWGVTQIGAVIGILFSIGFTTGLEREFEGALIASQAPKVGVSPSPTQTPPAPLSPPKTEPENEAAASAAGPSPSPRASRPNTERSSRRNRNRSGAGSITEVVARMPKWVSGFIRNWSIPFVVFLEYLGIATFVVLFPFTYALARLEFEQHWYIVTDRSLRIRTGVLLLSESTMSFANLQQVEVKQGPFQRLLGLADVRVRSAGGGGDAAHEHSGEALHTGVFKSVENATEIRDLIVARLRAFREAGLGDPDLPVEKKGAMARGLPPEALLAAREVLRQASALKQAVMQVRT